MVQDTPWSAAGLIAVLVPPPFAGPAEDGHDVVQLDIAPDDFWSAAALSAQQVAGAYTLDWDNVADANVVALGWAHGRYRFDLRGDCSPVDRGNAILVMPAECDIGALRSIAHACALMRRLVDLPPNMLDPLSLAEIARAHMRHAGGEAEIIEGPLLASEFPLIAAVGRGSAQPPCLLDACWGDPSHPRVTLVGKGVCFDSGGLSSKSSVAMAPMKKDMAGAAQALCLALILIEAKTPIRLRLILPCAENMPDGLAIRPGDIIRSRAGVTVEIDDTDSEGRLILADALALADAEAPDLLIDFATLTGAQRIACGYDLPGFFTHCDALAATVATAATASQDPLWRLPLFAPYKVKLTSGPADLLTCGHIGPGQAIIGALFLEHFVTRASAWIHVDFMAWATEASPGRPVGGEPQGLRAFARFISDRYRPADQHCN